MPIEECTKTYVCSSIDYDTGCAKVQNYCTINGQKASDNITTIDDSYPAFSTGTKIDNDNYNAIKPILQAIANFGKKGTKNPSISSLNNISNISEGTSVALSQYNNILSALNKTLLTGI